MHPQITIVCCDLWSGGIVGQFLFENAAENVIAVNGERDRGMIADFLCSEIKDINLNDLSINRMERHAIQLNKQSIFCALSSVIV